MRTVAVAVASLVALSAILVHFPLAAAAECEINPTAGKICQRIPVSKPVPPPPAPGIPPNADMYFDVYYLFLKPTACTSPSSSDCRGIPNANPGVPLPTGGTIGANVFGVLWQESNLCTSDLQRFPLGGCGGADRMILV